MDNGKSDNRRLTPEPILTDKNALTLLIDHCFADPEDGPEAVEQMKVMQSEAWKVYDRLIQPTGDVAELLNSLDEMKESRMFTVDDVEIIPAIRQAIAALQISEADAWGLVKEFAECPDMYLSDDYGLHTCMYCGKDYLRGGFHKDLPSNYPKYPTMPDDRKCANSKCPTVRARERLKERT